MVDQLFRDKPLHLTYRSLLAREMKLKHPYLVFRDIEGIDVFLPNLVGTELRNQEDKGIARFLGECQRTHMTAFSSRCSGQRNTSRSWGESSCIDAYPARNP